MPARHLCAPLLLTVLVASGCPRSVGAPPGGEPLIEAGSSGDPLSATPDAVTFPSNNVPCSEESAAQASAWFSAYYEWERGVRLEDVGELVVNGGGMTVFEDPAIVHLRADEIQSGARYVQLDQMQQTLDDHVARKKRERQLLGLDASAHPGIALGIAPDVSWSVVVAAIEAAVATGEPTVQFAFEAPRDRALTVPRALQAEYERELGAQELPERSRNQSGGCEAFSDAWGGLAKHYPEERGAYVAEQLPAAWLECGCRPDLEWVAVRLAYHRDNAIKQAAVTFAPDGDPVSLPADSPWTEAAPRLIAVSRARVALAR